MYVSKATAVIKLGSKYRSKHIYFSEINQAKYIVLLGVYGLQCILPHESEVMVDEKVGF